MRTRLIALVLGVGVAIAPGSAAAAPGNNVDSTANGESAGAAAAVPRTVHRYAPLVRLHPDDQDRPMSAATFIQNSSLRWSHDSGCSDDEIAGKGAIRGRQLRAGGYRHQVKSGTFSCDHHGRFFHSNERTRPRDGEAGGEGFFFDLDNGVRTGTGTSAPVYYEYRPGRYVTYWFLYGFNDSGLAAGNHEGDWEQISVRLNGRDRATHVAFYAHGHATIRPWSQVRKHQGHPIVFSANGSHGSYWKAGSFDRVGPGVITGKDHTANGGPAWKTWGKLRNVLKRSWYHYGGAWGEVGAVGTLTTGPIGPSAYKAPAPPGW